ncbi:COBRA-like protein 4 [Euphorbia lathyris]|uniref:COBRA-like protein 4 n=1 Tax=Euphorbia lathyris TaxID=212925 RepID=UPI003313251A
MDFCKLQWLIVAATVYVMRILQADGYDPLDPHGSINIRWDVMSWTPDGYLTLIAAVSINNNQMYRQIRRPGWTLGWKWSKKEVIWSMVGAEAIDQGDCSSFKANIPHCCKRNPEIVDLVPAIPITQQFRDCCKDGVMGSLGQDPSAAVSSFQLSVGISGTSNKTVKPPKDFYFLGPGPGYTCSAPTIVLPSVFFAPNGRRRTQAMMTWILSCTYSQVIASKYPTCCVSLSSFYNSKITPCSSCACGCHNEPNCARNDPKIASVVNPNSAKLECTEHMCPIRVHWHVKQNYIDYWVVKITITNFNYGVNYTHWTLVAQHPNLSNLTKLYKFMYKPLMQLYNPTNDSGMFYGIKYYNDVLPEAGKDGNVQSEMLFRKDNGRFRLQQGWAFPSKMYFNGDECVMPLPDSYPFLPNSVHLNPPSSSLLFITILISFFLYFHL